MDDFTELFIVSSISIIFIIILLFALWVHIGIANELKNRNENLKEEINILKHQKHYYKHLSIALKEEVDALKKDLKFQKTLTQTFSDGLDALIKKKNDVK